MVKTVVIGTNVWQGRRVMVLKSATMSDNSVIGVTILVMKGIASHCTTAGIPAEFICTV